MTTPIHRLIVFGDSMSDIGIKRNTVLGAIASLFGLMRTNQVQRYSDNRNWTDFIWEWAGGAPLIYKDKATSDARAARHLTWNQDAYHGSPARARLYYANYAEGGAMGGSDRSGTGLGTFQGQCNSYLRDLAATSPEGNALYLIWFGLNDLVTNGRDPNDMKKVAVEMSRLAQQIRDKDRDSYFLFGNLPNPQGAVRFLGKEATEQVRGFQTGSFEFGYELARELQESFPDAGALVDLYTPIEHINDNLGAYGLTKGSQPHGIEVYYGAAPRNPQAAFLTTTSDDAHPTEQVYKLIANVWAEAILKHHDLGGLRASGEGRFIVAGNK